MKEKWKDVKGYEGYYQVSNIGRVRSLDRTIYNSKGYLFTKKSRIVKQSDLKGYPSVTLNKDNHRQRFYVHRLVLTAFGKPVKGKDVVNHIDGNKYNNRVDNLEWCTIAENNQHAIDHGLRGTNLELFIEYRESRKRDICAYIDDECICIAKGPKRLAKALQEKGYFTDKKAEYLSSCLSHAALCDRKYKGITVKYI